MWVMERQRQLGGNGGRRKNRWTGRNTRWMMEEKSCGMKTQKKLKSQIEFFINLRTLMLSNTCRA